MDEVMSEYFLTDDKRPLLLKSGYSVPEYSSISDVLSYLDTVIDSDNIAYYQTGNDNDDGTVSYSVVSDDLKIAAVKLSPVVGNAERFPPYELSDITLTIGGSSVVSIDAPVGYSVYVNGYLLTDKNTDGEIRDDESCRHMYGDAVGIRYVTYTLDGIFGSPRVTAKRDGFEEIPNITCDESGIFYTVSPAYMTPDEDFSKNVLDAAVYIAAYLQSDEPLGLAAKYMDQTSELYANLRSTDTRWVVDHNGYSTESPQVTECYSYGGGVVSCRVKFKHVLYGYGTTYEENFDETFYLRDVGGTFLIYDSHNN